MKERYMRSRDPDVCGLLNPTETFYGERILNGVTKWVKYTIGFRPKFFEYSGNWTIRVHSRNLNKQIGLDKDDNLSEFIYINKQNIHRFLFPSTLVSKFIRDKQLTEIINQQHK